MKTTIRRGCRTLVALSLALPLLAGCGDGGQPGFTSDQVAGMTFAYAQTSGTPGVTGALAFKADGTWRSALGATVFSGTWTVDTSGRLVCVTTAGGNHTITYTLLEATAGVMRVGAVEVDPANPGGPVSFDATFSVAFTVEMIAGQRIAYSTAGGGGATGTIEFGHDGSWQTIGGVASYVGTWNVVEGKLVCATTTGGDHTITYTRLSATTDPLSASASEVDPADPQHPVISAVTLEVLSGLVTDPHLLVFNLNVTFKNLPESLPQTATTTPVYEVAPFRRRWLFFVPFFTTTQVPALVCGMTSENTSECTWSQGPNLPDPNSPSGSWGAALYPNGIPAGTPAAGPYPADNPTGYHYNPTAGTTASFGFIYGSTAGVGTIDDYFHFKVTYPKADGTTGQFETPLLGFVLWNAVPESSWVYDYADNTVTRTN